MKPTIFRPGGFTLTDLGAKQARIAKQSKVLDIGCGSGATLRHLQDLYGCRAAGIDISPACVSAASQLLPEADILHADACALPFEDRSFHAAFMECTLTLFSDPRAALSEAFRILVPKGTLVVSTFTREQGDSLIVGGAVCLDQLLPILRSIGFSKIHCTDHSDLLVQYVADLIFEYGSLRAYLEQATHALGGTILSCDLSPKDTRYHMITAQK